MVRINDALFDLPFPLTILIILFISYAWNPKFTCHLGYELYTNYVDHFFVFLTPPLPHRGQFYYIGFITNLPSTHGCPHGLCMTPDPLYVVYMFVGSKEE